MMKAMVIISFAVIIFTSSCANLGSLSLAVSAEDAVFNSVLIIEVYYDTYLPYEPEEYIKLYNPTINEINISGWQLTDLEGVIEFPDNTTLGSKASIYITRNATAFYEELGFKPDFEYEVDSMTSVPNMHKSSRSSLILSNKGDELLLKARDGKIIDTLVYGNSTYSDEGWRGKPARAVCEGAVLKRKILETSGEFTDTNSALDWDSPRVYKVRQSDFQYETFEFNGSITAFAAPDSSFDIITEELENAKESIYLSLYQLTNFQLAETLVNATERGVSIKILLEGSPVGWNLSNVDDYQEYYENMIAYHEAYLEKYILAKLARKGCQIGFMISSPQQNIQARYRYLHSKYAVVDNSTLIISSENWKPTGVPPDSTYGDRGWGVSIKNSEVAKYFAEVFFEDFDLSKKDVQLMDLTHEKYSPPPDWFVPNENIPKGTYKPKFSARTINSSFNISPILAPDTSLLESKSIINLLNSARESCLIELLSCNLNWGSYPNLYLDCALNAARRGCEVKILLDGKYIDAEENKTLNLDTALYVNTIAQAENLNLEARVVRFEASYLSKIHTKGVIIDGERVLISSINWNYNSVARNREAGVIIESNDLATYFEAIFSFDWNIALDSERDKENNSSKALISPGLLILLIFITIILLSLGRDLKRRGK